MNNIRFSAIILFCLLTSACVVTPPSHDYTEFRNSDPHSILILPPVNNSKEVIAPFGVMAQLTPPIAESGFYVLPVALVDQTFKSNGLTVANDIHTLPRQKLHEIFGAHAALYVTIEGYGTSYDIVSGDTVVSLSAKLIDIRSGALLWEDTAFASSAEQKGGANGDVAALLVQAVVSQIVETLSDKSFEIAGMASNRLVSSEQHNGFLYGPRSPKYGEPAPSEKSK